MTTNACCNWDFRTSLRTAKGTKVKFAVPDQDTTGSGSSESESVQSGVVDESIVYEEQKDFMVHVLALIAKRWAFQLELGEKTEYLHFQGRFSLKEKLRKKNLMDLMESYNWTVPGYLEPSSTEVAKSKDFFYVMKSKTRVAGPWTDKDEEKFIPIQFQNFIDKLYPYQAQIFDDDFHNPRQVNVVVSLKGCQGRSTISALCELMKRGIDVPAVYDSKELINIVCDIAIARNDRSPSPIIIDLPRSVSRNKLPELFSAVEQIKKGKLFDCRYKYRAFWINSPTVWVFMNQVPDLKYLSADRWKIWQINDKNEMEDYKPPVEESVFEEIEKIDQKQRDMEALYEQAEDPSLIFKLRLKMSELNLKSKKIQEQLEREVNFQRVLVHGSEEWEQHLSQMYKRCDMHKELLSRKSINNSIIKSFYLPNNRIGDSILVNEYQELCSKELMLQDDEVNEYGIRCKTPEPVFFE